MLNRLLLLFSCAAGLVLLEGGLRTFGPVDYRMPELVLIDGTTPWRTPGTFVPRPSYSYHDHDGYAANSLGMLDTEVNPVPPDSTIRVAFLGDSFLEGAAVPPGSRLTELIEEAPVEALNFGMSGTGTIDQLALYRRLVRPLHPDLVVLMVYPGNDIVDNDDVLAASIGVQPRLPASDSNPKTRIRAIMPSLYAHIHVAKRRLAARGRGVLPTSAYSEPSGSYLDVYHAPHPPADSLWTRAWSSTETAILELDAEVRRDGANLLVAVLPDPIHPYSGDIGRLEQMLGTALPANFDGTYPSDRLAGFLAARGIASLNLADRFRDFATANELTPPYFAFERDGHWDTLGHRVAAEALLPYVLNR